MVNRMIRSTHFDAVFATINQTLSPVYIGIVLAFLMCPIYNKLVRCFYHFLYKDGKLLTDSFGSMYFNTKVPKHHKRTAAQRALTEARMLASVICMAVVAGLCVFCFNLIFPRYRIHRP